MEKLVQKINHENISQTHSEAVTIEKKSGQSVEEIKNCNIWEFTTTHNPDFMSQMT